MQTMRKRNTYTKQQQSLGGLNKPRREERFEEIIERYKQDRKGTIIARGVTYSSNGIDHWQIAHSRTHTNKFEVMHNGYSIANAGPRKLPTKWIRNRTKQHV